jgi:Rrf2 family protein
MKVSKRGEYGMRALCHLAERFGEGYVHVKRISDAEGIPQKFLEGILLELRRAGVLHSRRGNEGGYSLARSPETILVGDVMRLLDGPLAPLASASELRQLAKPKAKRRGFYSVMLDVRNAVSEILDKTTFADLLEQDAIGPERHGRDVDGPSDDSERPA